MFDRRGRTRLCYKICVGEGKQMNLHANRCLHGRRILIVESEVRLLHELIGMLEGTEGAEAFYVTDPHAAAGTERIAAFTSCAAVINGAHRGIAKALDVPVLVYGVHTAVPAEAGAIVRALKEMLPPE
jgi:hypothetical protein